MLMCTTNWWHSLRWRCRHLLFQNLYIITGITLVDLGHRRNFKCRKNGRVKEEKTTMRVYYNVNNVILASSWTKKNRLSRMCIPQPHLMHGLVSLLPMLFFIQQKLHYRHCRKNISNDGNWKKKVRRKYGKRWWMRD